MIEVSFTQRYPKIKIEVSLSLQRGFNFILGPSGCGKTTVIKTVSGLLKPDEGLVKCCDEVFLDTRKGIFLPPQRRRIGVVFQEHGLLPHLKVRENLSFAIGKVRQVRFRPEELLERFGLKGLENRYPDELSGGQKQRVAVVMALAFNPRALLMDEPFSSLDVDTKLEIIEFLKELELNIPVLVVSHDPVEALLLADRVFIMKEGRIIRQGGKEVLGELLDKLYGRK